mmetsp:Transcript_13255/g.18666  ORF Transcript_13255/g.18666 Transcript_13255/m.18666 type:complete len:515 (-) Transcript_13255:13-1557(-)
MAEPYECKWKNEEEIASNTVPVLKDELTNLNLSTKGKKAELISRILDHINSNSSKENEAMKVNEKKANEKNDDWTNKTEVEETEPIVEEKISSAKNAFESDHKEENKGDDDLPKNAEPTDLDPISLPNKSIESNQKDLSASNGLTERSKTDRPNKSEVEVTKKIEVEEKSLPKNSIELNQNEKESLNGSPEKLTNDSPSKTEVEVTEQMKEDSLSSCKRSLDSETNNKTFKNGSPLQQAKRKKIDSLNEDDAEENKAVVIPFCSLDQSKNMIKVDSEFEKSEKESSHVTNEIVPEEKTIEPKKHDDKNAGPVSIRIDNFVRPFTAGQARELIENAAGVEVLGFWMDKIKTHAIATLPSQIYAERVKNELEGLQWPEKSSKQLSVSDSAISAVDAAVQMINTNKAKVENHLDNKDLKLKAEKNIEAEEEHAISLDDLYQRTKVLPMLYWLPITLEQIEERKQLTKATIKQTDLPFDDGQILLKMIGRDLSIEKNQESSKLTRNYREDPKRTYRNR